MKGENQLLLNMDTTTEAIEKYLNSQSIKRVVVSEVEFVDVEVDPKVRVTFHPDETEEGTEEPA